jgi:hypothetical protein
VLLLLDDVEQQRRPLLVSTGLAAYAETWAAENAYTGVSARRLSRLEARDFPERWRQLVAGFPDLFDAAHAHTALAERMAASDDPWAELRSLGVPDPHGPGLWAEAQGEWLRRIKGTLDTDPGIDRVLHRGCVRCPSAPRCRLVGRRRSSRS